jgi:hypothetical protein
MGIEWVVFGGVLAAGALFVGFPSGVAVGYVWRDRISRARRHLAEQERRRAELIDSAAAHARMVAGRSDGLGKPEDVAAASLSPSIRVIGIPQATASRARKKVNGSKDPVANSKGKDSKRKAPTKSKLKVTGDLTQEPDSERTSNEATIVKPPSRH